MGKTYNDTTVGWCGTNKFEWWTGIRQWLGLFLQTFVSVGWPLVMPSHWLCVQLYTKNEWWSKPPMFVISGFLSFSTIASCFLTILGFRMRSVSIFKSVSKCYLHRQKYTDYISKIECAVKVAITSESIMKVTVNCNNHEAHN